MKNERGRQGKGAFLRRPSRKALALWLCLLGPLACDSRSPSGPGGYTGPVVTQAGLARLEELEDKEFTDRKSELGGGNWTVSIVRKTPHPVTGRKQGPVLVVSQGSEVRVIPIQSDGDVADIYARVVGKPPPGIGDAPTAPYLEAWRRGGKPEPGAGLPPR
jgi:hypothetical protein